MEKKKTISVGTLVIGYICAVLWIINVILAPSLLNIVLAIAWTWCAVGWTLRYRKEKKEQE